MAILLGDGWSHPAQTIITNTAKTSSAGTAMMTIEGCHGGKTSKSADY
jgi:hypothetical protein